jgi:ABC-type multidrug transport system ATPase subunit
MIEAVAVSFAYGAAPVLEAVDCSIGAGLTLLVGPNGCGKSTLLKLCAGVERPDAGRVTVGGHDLWRDEVAARRLLAYVPEHPDLTPYASLREVMLLVCRLRHEPAARADEVLERAGLGARAHASVRELSAGQRRRALLAAAWIGTPRVVLLDEPLELLDRRLRDDVVGWVEALAAAGATIVVISHQVEPFVPAASRVLTVRDARTVGPLDLPPDEPARSVLVERFARGQL